METFCVSSTNSTKHFWNHLGNLFSMKLRDFYSRELKHHNFLFKWALCNTWLDRPNMMSFQTHILITNYLKFRAFIRLKFSVDNTYELFHLFSNSSKKQSKYFFSKTKPTTAKISTKRLHSMEFSQKLFHFL